MAAPQAGCTLKARGAKALREVQMGFCSARQHVKGRNIFSLRCRRTDVVMSCTLYACTCDKYSLHTWAHISTDALLPRPSGGSPSLPDLTGITYGMTECV